MAAEILEVGTHEGGHALVAYLIGRNVISVRVSSDGSAGEHRAGGAPTDRENGIDRLFEETLGGPVAQAMYRLGPAAQKEAVQGETGKILRDEAQDDARQLSNYAYALGLDTRGEDAYREARFATVFDTLALDECRFAVRELAEAIVGASPESFAGEAAEEIIRRHVGPLRMP